MQLSQAIINGRSHRLMQKNGQDYVVTGQPAPGYGFGIVLDGCGSKYRDSDGITSSQNEIGANLLGQYATAFIENQLPTINNQQSMDEFLAQFYGACITYLDCLTALIPWKTNAERGRFIGSHLLSTLVGFVVTPKTAVCFWSGDGHLCINGDIISLDSDNHPDYLAYQLLNLEKNGHFGLQPRSPLSAGRFNTLTLHNRQQLDWLAVATDGWNSHLLTQLSQPRTSLSLQRWINIQAHQRQNFEDDGAVAIFYNQVQVRGSKSPRAT